MKYDNLSPNICKYIKVIKIKKNMELGNLVTEMKIHRVTQSEGQWSHSEFNVWKQWIEQQT